MTLEELKETIDELCETCGEPSKVFVRLALQPNYPMKGDIQNFCLEHDSQRNPKRLWIACSDCQSYGCPRDAWDETEIYTD